MHGPHNYSGGSPHRQTAHGTKTLPRFLHSTPIGHTGQDGPSSFAQSQSSSMYLSEWHGAISDEFPNPLREYGYPSDYGLPLSADERQSHVTVNPLTGIGYGEDISVSPNGRHAVNNMNLSNNSSGTQ